jgi:tetratricopeptide (TPR) repeat protein
MTWWGKLLLAVGGAVALGLNAAPAGLLDILAKGDQALVDGLPADALSLYQQLSAHAEGKPAATLGTARAQLALAQQETVGTVAAFGLARDAWLAAVPYHGFDASIRRGLAEAFLGLGETLAAAEQWDAVFAANPADPSLWYQLAPAHLERGAWEAARRAYDAIAAADPDNTEAHYWAGTLHLLTDAIQAQGHLLHARTDPFYTRRSDRLLAAISDLQNITDPSHAAGRLGIAFLEAGEPALAEIQFRVALEQEPDYADAWAYLGLAESQLGKDGWRAVARAIELEPDSSLAHSMMGHHWLGHGRPHLARPEFIAAWQLNSTNPAHLADVASTYQAEGDLASAEAWYQAAVRQDPDDTAFWILLARFLLEASSGQLNDGLLVAQKAVAVEPEDPAALDTLGWAQFLNGKPRLAETNLMAARQRDPSSPATHYHLGRLYLAQYAWQEAVESFEHAIALDSICRGCRRSRPGSYGRLAQRALEEMER